jgi:hypothetical protein
MWRHGTTSRQRCRRLFVSLFIFTAPLFINFASIFIMNNVSIYMNSVPLTRCYVFGITYSVLRIRYYVFGITYSVLRIRYYVCTVQYSIVISVSIFYIAVRYSTPRCRGRGRKGMCTKRLQGAVFCYSEKVLDLSGVVSPPRRLFAVIP